MKKILNLLIVACVVLPGCIEKSPIVVLTNQPPVADTTYTLLTVPTPEPHNVLIEDITGASCTNCPHAHDVVKNLSASNPGRVNAISMFVYIDNFDEANPTATSKYDFRTTAGTNVMKNVYQSVTSLPNGGVDRMPLGSVATPLQTNYPDWSNTARQRMDNTVNDINLALTCSYDAIGQKLIVKPGITYLKATTDIYNINLVVVEDSIIDRQVDNHLPAPYLDTAYHFNNVLRDVITTVPYGDKIAPSLTTKVKGLVYERTYTYGWNPKWDPANCLVIAFVTNGSALGATNVYQSKQVRVKP